MEPIKLEIFINDKTRQGIDSVEGNIGNVKQYMQSVIAQLEAEMAGMQRKFQEALSKGVNSQSDMADIQALQGAIRQLREELKRLEEAKARTSSSPIIDDQHVERKMNNLKMQFSQVARELPSLAMGPQMFFLAISNNLPMLTDAIKDVRKENEMLAASGKKGVPVWKQLGGALFSWNTLLMAGISLLVVYGKDITKWIGSLFKGKDALTSVADAQEKVNEEIGRGAGSYGKQVATVKSLSDKWKELGDSLKDKKKFITDNKDEFEKLGVAVSNVDDAENLLVKNTDSFVTAMGLRAAAAAAFKLSSEEAEKALKKQMEIDLEKKKGPSTWDKVKSGMVNAIVSSQSSFGSVPFSTTAEGYHKENIKELEQEKKTAEDASQAYIDLYNAKMKAAKEALAGAGIIEDKVSRNGKGGRKDYASELAEARLRMQQKVEKTRIDVMRDGYEKRRKIAKNEYDESIADIDRTEKKIIAHMDASRKQGDSIPESEYQKTHELADQQRKLQKQKLNNDLLAIDQEYYDKASEDLLEYNRKYGTYQEKRSAITAQFAKKIFSADNDAVRMSLQKDMDAALSELDMSEFKKKINFAEIFGDLDKQTTDALIRMREQLAEGIEKSTEGPEDMKEMSDALKEIDDVINSRKPFSALGKSLDEYVHSQSKVKKAQDDLNTVMAGGTVITGIYEDENGKLAVKTLSLAEAERNLGKAQSERQETLSKMTKAANSIGQQGSQLVNSGTQLVGMLENFGVKVPEAVSATLDGIGQTMSALESIDITRPFSAVTGILGTIAGIGNTIGGLFGFGAADYSGYEKMVEQYDTLIEVWDTLIDKKMEYIDIDYGTEAQKAAKEAEQLVKTNIQRQRNLLEQLAKSGSGTFSHSLGYRINDRMSSSDWARLSNLLGKTIKDQSDLWKLSSEEIEKILGDDKLIAVLDRVNSDFVEYLKNIVEYGNQLDEIAAKEEAAISGLSFEDFRDGYIDMIADLEATNEDFAENFEKQLQNAIFRALIADQYSEKIKELYDSWVNMGKDGLTQSEVEYLREQQDKLTDEMLAKRKELMDLFGWKVPEEENESFSREIKGLSELQKAYERLNDSAGKAYSSERVRKIQEQNKNLAEQKRLIEERMAIEKDADSLDDYRNQLEDISKQIEENKEAMKDAIFGSDIQNAINEFVSAYTDALGAGDTSGLAGSFVENMIRGMVAESMKADASPVIASIREKLIDAWKDGIISSEEQAEVEDLINALNKELGDKYQWSADLYKKPEKVSSEISGLKELSHAYNELSQAVSEAYSTDKVNLLREQCRLLEEQKRLLEERIAAGADDALVDGWSNQLEDINKQIANNKTAQLDAIFGSDTQNAINSFANAFIDAWAKGEDKAKSVGNITKSIIRNMVAESMKMDMEPQIKELREKLAEMYKDGVITSEENSIISELVKGMTDALEKQYGWADEFIREEEHVADEIAGTVEKIEESITGISLESFSDSFISGLSDMNKSWSDMCTDFEDMLRQSILKGLVETQYKDKIARLHSMWESAASSNGIDEKEAEQLRNEYMQIVQDLTKQRDEMAEAFGWVSASNQSPTSGALTTVSQDSIATFEGIGRSLQTHLISTDKNIEEIKESAVIDSKSLAQIAENTSHLGPIRELIEKFDRDGIKVH